MGKTKVQSKTTTKQKIVTAVVILAVSAGAFGVLSAIGSSQGYGFGWPFVKTSQFKYQKTRFMPKAPTRTSFIKNFLAR